MKGTGSAAQWGWSLGQQLKLANELAANAADTHSLLLAVLLDGPVVDEAVDDTAEERGVADDLGSAD